VSAGWLIFGDGFSQGLLRTVVKRLFDIVCALILLVLASPVILVTGLLILLESGGPILYLQERVGLNGRLFNVVKFRSMRTDAERAWVGFVPGAHALAWKQWPGMAMNAAFDAQLRAAVPPGGRAVMLCRSGVRSIAAARRATELGIEAFNILEGFEGDADADGHRGRRGGWRFHGLPWRQN
jgi:rhodanese-related sulfurtransferase